MKIDGSEAQEPEEKPYFGYSATLRIFGKIDDLDAITRRLTIAPTYTHRRGERKGSWSPEYTHDMWSYSPNIAETEQLERHIDSLWSAIKPHKDYLLELKRSLAVDVFLGYRSNCDHAGLELPHTCLEMFTELKIPFGLSIIVA